MRKYIGVDDINGVPIHEGDTLKMKIFNSKMGTTRIFIGIVDYIDTNRHLGYACMADDGYTVVINRRTLRHNKAVVMEV